MEIYDYIIMERALYGETGNNKMESIIIDDVVLKGDAVKVWVGDEFSLKWLKDLKFEKISR